MAKYSKTFTQLIQMLKDWQENEETKFSTELDNAINLACVAVARDLNLEKHRKRATGTFTSGTATLTVPTDIIVLDTLLVNDGTDNQPMEERAGAVLELYTGSGLPLYWSEQDTNSVRVAPTPDSNYDYVAYGIQRPELLVESSNETNWLTTNVPDLVFLKSLEWSDLFLIDDTRADVWRNRYMAELGAAREELGLARRNSEKIAPTPDATTGQRNEQQ